MTHTLTDLRALATRHDPTIDVSMPPSVLLALLDQLAESERVRDVYQGTTETLTGIVAELLGVPADDDAAICDALKKARENPLASPETMGLRLDVEKYQAADVALRSLVHLHLGVEDADDDPLSAEQCVETAASTIARLTSEAEALRALVPNRRVRAEIREAFESYDADGYEETRDMVFAWLQRIEAARAAEGGG